MWIQSAIRSNQIKTLLLVLCFPVLVSALVILVLVFAYRDTSSSLPTAIMMGMQQLWPMLLIVGPLTLVRGLISFLFHRQMIFAFSGATPVTRSEYPSLYNSIENLCISRGLPVPHIGVMDDESMNAFAVGRNPKKSWIVFSKGILNRLNKAEIEAVAGHELTHIMNQDGLLMTVVVVWIGIVATLGEYILRIGRRSSRSDEKDNKIWLIITLIGVGLLVLGYLFFPLIQLALSRRREFLADAGSVELTHDKYAMISALEKISSDATIESIDQYSVAAICIDNPLRGNDEITGMTKRLSNLFATHPPIADRIKALQGY